QVGDEGGQLFYIGDQLGVQAQLDGTLVSWTHRHSWFYHPGKVRRISLSLEESDDELPGGGAVHFADGDGPEEGPVPRIESDETCDPSPEQQKRGIRFLVLQPDEGTAEFHGVAHVLEEGLFVDEEGARIETLCAKAFNDAVNRGKTVGADQFALFFVPEK